MKKLKLLTSLFLKNPGAGMVGLGQIVRKKILPDYQFLDNGWAFYPATIIFHPTARCNLACEMCVINSYSKSLELDFKQIKKIIDQIAFFKPHFYIAGGEPLLRGDLEKIIAYTKRRGLLTTLTTNGILLTESRIKTLLAAGIDGVAVSIDGPQKIDDQIRGKGHFKKAILALRQICEWKRSHNLVLPKLKVATVISGLTQNCLAEMVNLADNLGVEEIIFFHLDYKSPKMVLAHREQTKKIFGQPVDCLGYWVNEKPLVREKEFIEIRPKIIKEQIKQIFSYPHSVSISFAPPIASKEIDNYYSGKYFRHFRCANPWFSTTILPNGDLVPCFSLRIGNLLKNNFKDLWNSHLYKKFRRHLKTEGKVAGCFRCCGALIIK